MADELRRALARAELARTERGEYGRLTFEALGKMVADWLEDPAPYTGEAVRTWIQTGRDPGFAVTVALLALLAPDADLRAVAKATYLRRVPRGQARPTKKAAHVTQTRAAKRATGEPPQRKRGGNAG